MDGFFERIKADIDRQAEADIARINAECDRRIRRIVEVEQLDELCRKAWRLGLTADRRR